MTLNQNTKPRMIPDVAIFTMPDALGVQIRGAGAPVLLRGGQVEEVLGFLVPVLDGTRTVREICAAAPPGITPEAIRDLVAVLDEKGLLSGGPAPLREVDPLHQRQILFWERHRASAPHRSSGSDIQKRVGRARVVLVATGVFGTATLGLLARSGIGELRVLAWDDDGTLPASPEAQGADELDRLPTTSVDAAARRLREWAADADLVVTATRNAPAALFEAMNRICLDASIPWLHANEAAGLLDVGPCVLPFESACYECMRLRELSTREHQIEEALYQEALAAERPSGTTAPRGELYAAATMGASLVAMEALRIIAQHAAPPLAGAVLQVALATGESVKHTVRRVPRCPECYRGAGRAVA